MPRAWTAEDEQLLCKYFALRHPAPVIAQKLDRTVPAVTSRLEKLGLTIYRHGVVYRLVPYYTRPEGDPS